jgi:hypothetical protein
MTRQLLYAAFIATVVLPQLTLAQQPQQRMDEKVAVDDDTARRFFLHAIANAPDYRVQRANGDTALRVFRIRYGTSVDSLPWLPLIGTLLDDLHARLVNDSDQVTREIFISSFHLSGDQLDGVFAIGDRHRCPSEPWTGGGTIYGLTATRGTAGWGPPIYQEKGVGDTLRCR